MKRENTMNEIIKYNLNSSIEIKSIVKNDTNINDTNINDTNDNKIISNTNANYKKSTIEILISVWIHTFIMAIFEIYFYFQYIIIIEKEMFMDKINQYTNQFNNYYMSDVKPEQKLMLTTIFPQKKTQELLQLLYTDYQNSLKEQQHLLNLLLIKSYKMLVVITSVLILFLTTGIYYYSDKIKWKHIMIENILMFLCLGVFEYMFFINIILYYSPVSDAEIKYTIAKQMLLPFSNNVTIYNY